METGPSKPFVQRERSVCGPETKRNPPPTRRRRLSLARFPRIPSGHHHPRRRPPWPRPSPSRSLAAHPPPLPWPPPAAPGPRRCAGGGIAPSSRPSPQPADLTQTRKAPGPGGGRCSWRVLPRPPRLFPGPIQRHVSCPSNLRPPSNACLLQYPLCWSHFTSNTVYLVRTECHSDLL